MKKGYITLSGSKQDYDLQDVWADVSESGKRIEVHRVFNHMPAAVSRFYDPYAGSFDQRQLLDAFGFGNVSPAISFVLKPISYDLARANAIETSDLIRKSAYSFELHNNNLRIFPIPQDGDDGEKYGLSIMSKTILETQTILMLVYKVVCQILLMFHTNLLLIVPSINWSSMD